MILEHYQKLPSEHYENEYRKIESWLNREDEVNRPLVIRSGPGVGRKVLLSQWYEHHRRQQKRAEDILILHFGSSKQSYFEVIYKTLIKLRHFLNIDQKVELHGEKLRTYFKYWLDLCNRYIENQIINSAECIYSKIIIVLDAIDQFVDCFNGEHLANVSLWLPQFFPPNIKVIVTGEENSEAVEYFLGYGCESLTVGADPAAVSRYLDLKEQEKSVVPTHKKRAILQYIKARLSANDVSPSLIQNFLSILLPEVVSTPVIAESLEKKIGAVDLASFD